MMSSYMQKDILHGIIPATPRPASVMTRAWLLRLSNISKNLNELDIITKDTFFKQKCTA